LPVYRIDQDLQQAGQAQLIFFRHRYANGALAAMGVQLFLADGLFAYYLVRNIKDLPAPVMSAWLGAGVIQVIGVVVVITRYLFPPVNVND
jgi:hypothetical protein